MTRASALVETLGIPTVTVLCSGFVKQGQLTAKGLGMPHLPHVIHPGHVNFVTPEELEVNVAGPMMQQVIQGLTVQPPEAEFEVEPDKRDVIFSGTFEEVNDHFLLKEWSEGLPIVPPTVEKIEEFLRFTDRSPDELLGTLLPDSREGTVWNVAANGVMSGCRPEYMPVLLAVVEGMLDPVFGHEHLGHTPATETLIIVGGEIVKQLGFNSGQAALRPGFQANTSIGRFWRMYLRNVAGFLPQKTDKGCFGGNFRIVLAENEAAVTEMGWPTHSADEGYQPGDSIVTVTSCTEMTQAIEVGDPSAEQILRNIEARMADNHMFIQFFFRGMVTRPTVILTPAILKVLTDQGWTKQAVREHFYENAKLHVNRLSGMIVERFYRGIRAGNWPEQLGTSMDLDRDIQMVSSPDDFIIVVAGDPDRDHVMIGSGNGYIGFPVTKPVRVPESWDTLLADERKRQRRARRQTR